MSQTLGKGTNVGNSQMEWLYDSSSGKPTNDDYLMGKAVDKDFERMGTEGQINAVEYDCCPESIFSSQVDHQVDLQRKLQEDPLVSLRMKEVDTRKKILDNPLKMREINAYIDSIKKKKHKKEKKRKKHKREKDSDNNVDKDLDQILLQKLKSMSGDGSPENKIKDVSSSKHSRKKAFLSDNTSDSSAEEEKHSNKKHRKKRNNSSSPERSSKSKHYKKERSVSPSKSFSKSSNRYYTSARKDFGAEPKFNSRTDRRDNGSRYSPPTKRRSRSPQFGKTKHIKKDIDESERAKKLKEMMENANWREDQRTNKVKKHRLKESEEEDSRNKKHDPSFIRKELARAAESGSVEKRIKSNRHNIQRGVSSMSENFARR